MDLMPGLYAAALAIVLVAALRRWYDRVPWRVVGAFAVPLGVLLGPVLFGGKVLLPLDNLRGQAPFQSIPGSEPHGNLLQGDLIELVTPSLVVAREAWKDGQWPLWNPRVGAGMPLLADPQAQVLQPIALVAMPLNWARAAGVMAFLRILLALVFTFLWMRRQGLGERPALAGAFAFGLSGFLILWLGWPMANSAALLPALLYGLARCRQVGGRRDFLLLAGAASSLLLGGHPETVVYAFGLGLVYLGGLAVSDGVAPRRRFVGRVALAMGIAAAVAAPALLATADYLPQTLRASRLGEPAAEVASVSWGEDLARRWLPIAAPNAYGNSRFVHYWGLKNTNEDAGGFVGTATLLAVLVGLGARRRFPQEWLFVAVAVVCLALLSPVGVGTRRVLLPLAFCLAYLGACALERIARGEVFRWVVPVAAAGLGAVIAWGYLAHPDPADPARLEVLRFGWLHWQGRFLVLAALLLAFGSGRRWVAPGMAGLIAAELLLAHLPANPPMPKRLVTAAESFSVRFLRDSARPGRVMALGKDLPANVASLYQMSDVRVYNPMAPAEYLRYLEPVISGWWGEKPLLGAPRHPIYRRLGVRTVLTAPGKRLPLRPLLQDESAWIYRAPAARPRLYPAGEKARGRVRIKKLEDQRIAARYRLPQGGQIGSSVYQDGGWRLVVDAASRTGKDGPFFMAELPAGEGDLDLVYRPRGFLAGCLLAALGIAAGVAWWGRPPAALS